MDVGIGMFFEGALLIAGVVIRVLVTGLLNDSSLALVALLLVVAIFASLVRKLF